MEEASLPAEKQPAWQRILERYPTWVELVAVAVYSGPLFLMIRLGWFENSETPRDYLLWGFLGAQFTLLPCWLLWGRSHVVLRSSLFLAFPFMFEALVPTVRNFVGLLMLSVAVLFGVTKLTGLQLTSRFFSVATTKMQFGLKRLFYLTPVVYAWVVTARLYFSKYDMPDFDMLWRLSTREIVFFVSFGWTPACILLATLDYPHQVRWLGSLVLIATSTFICDRILEPFLFVWDVVPYYVAVGLGTFLLTLPIRAAGFRLEWRAKQSPCEVRCDGVGN